MSLRVHSGRIAAFFLVLFSFSPAAAQAQGTSDYLRGNTPYGTERGTDAPDGADDSTIGSTRALGGAELALSPDWAEFSDMAEWQRFTLRNAGEMATSALSLSVENGRYRVDRGSCGSALDAGASCELQVQPISGGTDQMIVSAEFGGTVSAQLETLGEGDSCLDILQKGIDRGAGVYRLTDPDGGFYEAWCDMTTDGGGWTLVMRFDSNDTALRYVAPQWETTQLLNPDDLTPANGPGQGNAKFEAYNHVPGSVLRLRFHAPARSGIHGKDLRVHGQGNRTALQIFSGGGQNVHGSTRMACNGNLLTRVPEWDASIMRFGRASQFYGINHNLNRSYGGHNHNMKIRLGFASNDEWHTAGAPMIGVGTHYHWTYPGINSRSEHSIRWGSFGPNSQDCWVQGAGCGCYGHGGSQGSGPVGGNLWIR